MTAAAAAESDALGQLVRALGAEIVTEHAPLAVEGARLAATLRPRSAEECAAALRELAAARIPALVRGGGTQLEAANAPCAARVLLDTTGLCAAPEIDADEGVARCAAGTPLAEIAAQLAPTIWELPLDPPAAASTLGGALASAAVGPRFGHPRDVVLGISVALSNGDLVKSGGRVVKNVTGYDLGKLFVGSHGALGVITSAWIRLRPRPERCEALVAPAPADPALALAAGRAPSARAAGLVDAALAPELCALASSARALVLELAGDEAAVAADRAAFTARLGAISAPPSAQGALRAAQGAGPIRFRIAALPSEQAALRDALAAAGARTLAHPARGLVWAIFANGADADGRSFDAHLAAVRAAARAAGGGWRVEAAPAELRTGREVCGERDATLPLQRALKRSFDPHGILNPGRGFGET